MPSRTSEFKACVESARLRLANVPEHKQRLLAVNSRDARRSQRSEFAGQAADIGREIQATMGLLEKLAHLAKRKTLFDDRPVEISELTYIIKRNIASLNSKIANLQKIASPHGSSSASKGKQAEEHNNNVLVMLQGALANTSVGFRDVLEIRTQNMKASKSRTEQFGYTNQNASASGPPSVLRARHSQSYNNVNGNNLSDSVLYQNAASSSSLKDTYSRPGSGLSQRPQQPGNGPLRPVSPFVPADNKGKARASQDGNDYLALDMGNGGASAYGQESGQQMQMQVQQGNEYLGQRATAIESIESTIQELGQIFTQLATMVAQQGETVQRIDADTSDIANNVSGAQRELLKYYASISGNRALMLKIFGILIIFFLVFTLVT
ncbi:t-SNARE [Cystobasidium minutum MCA 4210]|uniref:t-SNARE n=1 Tax=Cystobasidium minutum MCA 4210 TaxID=1397322 RepID=UPI0034CF405D|eukprot:jgi/Rhomi1/151409/estExt_Genewise1.C_3_t20198